jgi:hypothetical protein
MKKILMITASVLLLITFIPNVQAQEEVKLECRSGYLQQLYLARCKIWFRSSVSAFGKF